MAATARPLVYSPWHAELRDSYVRLVDGTRHLDFHHVWLRDEVGANVGVDEARVDDTVLRVTWRDGRVSRFPITWLLQNAYARDRADIAIPLSNVEALELKATTIGPDILRRAFSLIDRRGAAVLRRESKTPADETGEWHAALAVADFRPVATGSLPARAEELPTALPDDSHAEELRHYQFLHVRAPTNGLLLLADHAAALGYLASIDADAAKRLLITPPKPERRPHLPFSEVQSWFRARELFTRVIRDPRHHYRVRVRPGDVVIYDRRRILYGQTEGTERAIHSLHVLGPDRTG